MLQKRAYSLPLMQPIIVARLSLNSMRDPSLSGWYNDSETLEGWTLAAVCSANQEIGRRPMHLSLETGTVGAHFRAETRQAQRFPGGHIGNGRCAEGNVTLVAARSYLWLSR
jgi:hypothetical protein